MAYHARERSEAGFTMVEVIVALLILTIGILGLAGTTALLVRQVTMSDMSTERVAAVQTVVERLRALPYDSVEAGSESVGHFAISWTSTADGNSKVLEIVSVGPGITSASGFPSPGSEVADTLEYRILRP